MLIQVSASEYMFECVRALGIQWMPFGNLLYNVECDIYSIKGII